jgi:archaellum component FlaC
MTEIFARQADLDKLTAQMEKFFEKLNELFITKELHQMAQQTISNKLDKIEGLIEQAQKTTNNRLTALEQIDNNRKSLKKSIYWLIGVVSALSSIHFFEIIKKVFSN